MAAPTDITGLLNRWRADSIAQADGTAVASWPALTGGAALAQSTTANQPLYKTGVVNGHPVVRFDGSNDMLAVTGGIPHAQPVTVSMVVRLAAVGTQQQLFLASTSQVWSNGMPWAVNAGGSSLTGGTSDTNWHVITAVLNGAGTAVYDNGAQIITGNAGSTGLDGTRFQVGQFSSGRNLNGDVAEIVVYDHALTASELATLDRYYTTQYGLSLADAPAAPALSGTLPLDGSGTLVLSGVGTAPQALEVTGTGTLTLTYIPQAESGALATAGEGTLALSGSGTWPRLAVTITAEPDATPPRLRIDVADTRTTPATSLTISRRNPDGHVYPVRTADGGPLQLSAGQATLYDYEAPYDSPLTFTTDDPGGPTVVTELDVPDVWLVHPGVPSRSMRLTVTNLPERARGSSRGVFQILGRADPLVISSGARGSATATLGVRTRTDAERRALDLLLDDDDVLFLNIPPVKGWGWDAVYISVADVTEARSVRWLSHPYREWSLPFAVVARPGGGTQAAITWDTVAAQYATWQAIADAGVGTWAELTAPTS